MRRRDLLKTGALATGALAFGPSFWRNAFAAPAHAGPGPYGPLQPANIHGIRLPAGFKSRRIAQGLLPVIGTTYAWHLFSDGQATFPTNNGFILVSNSEVPSQVPGKGGASAIRFRSDGKILDAYRILENTTGNCAGGGTPWGTWMSCEEHDEGLVWECDPYGVRKAVARPAMGEFSHEALCVDPVGKRLYLTEDQSDGCLYRFTPTNYPDCSSGLLEVAVVGPTNVGWAPVPDPSATTTPTRNQVPGATRFRRGEGIWFDSGIVYIATTGNSRIHAYDTTTQTIDVLYDGAAMANPPFTQVDNITVSKSGDLFVCEDPGKIGMGIITPEGEAARFLQVTGAGQVNPASQVEDVQNEITGVIFDPSGRRMFFSAQRSFLVGVIYEITGPFRLTRPA